MKVIHILLKFIQSITTSGSEYLNNACHVNSYVLEASIE